MPRNLCFEIGSQQIIHIQVIKMHIKGGRPVSSQKHVTVHEEFGIFKLRTSSKVKFGAFSDTGDCEVSRLVMIKSKISQFKFRIDNGLVESARAMQSKVHAPCYLHPSNL